jgi:hypothetical protein
VNRETRRLYQKYLKARQLQSLETATFRNNFHSQRTGSRWVALALIVAAGDSAQSSHLRMPRLEKS